MNKPENDIVRVTGLLALGLKNSIESGHSEEEIQASIEILKEYVGKIMKIIKKPGSLITF